MQETEINPLNAFNLSGKVAVITGASKGIGEAIARYFAAYGAKVVVSSRKQADVEAVAANLVANGGQAVGIACHTGLEEQCRNLIDKTVEVYGGIDILVNNAATNPSYGPSVEVDGSAFDKIMAINVKSPFELAKMAYPIMKARGGGNVINISSIAGLTPDPGLGMYSVSKAAMNMLTKVLAKEWGPDNIRVNAICPGLIKTKFSEALWSNPKVHDGFVKHLPIKRMGTVDEIAGMALYLVSDVSGYCTGSIFTADGGTTI